MSRIIMAKVILRDICDPGLPGDCAPIIQIAQASELEGLVSEHGVIFEEPIQEQEETFADPEDYDKPSEDLAWGNETWEAPDDIPEGPELTEGEKWEAPNEVLDGLAEGDECPLEPDRPWDESVCGELERRILSRVLGG